MTHVIACPVCTESMREINRDGIDIDVCERCGGVWLDHGELEKLVARKQRQHRESLEYRMRAGRNGYREPHDDDDDDLLEHSRHDRAHRGAPRERGKIERLLEFFD